MRYILLSEEIYEFRKLDELYNKAMLGGIEDCKNYIDKHIEYCVNIDNPRKMGIHQKEIGEVTKRLKELEKPLEKEDSPNFEVLDIEVEPFDVRGENYL